MDFIFLDFFFFHSQHNKNIYPYLVACFPICIYRVVSSEKKRRMAGQDVATT
jgi:hypothetical protein